MVTLLYKHMPCVRLRVDSLPYLGRWLALVAESKQQSEVLMYENVAMVVVERKMMEDERTKR